MIWWFSKVFPSSFVPINSTFVWLRVLDQLSANPASSVIRETGHQIDTLCKAMWWRKSTRPGSTDEKLESLSSCSVGYSVLDFRCVFLVLTEFDDVLDRLQQGLSQAVRPVIETTSTSENEKDVSTRKNKFLSKWLYRMKKAWVSVELAWLFVTGPTDPVAKPTPFHCQLCQRDMSVLTHGSFEILWHYQGAEHFAMYQRMRLETPDWRVLGFIGNPMPDEEVERQRVKIMRIPLVRRDREYPFCEDLITDDTGVVNPQLAILAKISSLLEVLWLDGNYDLMEQLWAQFLRTTRCVNFQVCWLRNEVLISFCICFVSNTYRFRKITYLFHILLTDFCLQSFLLNGMFTRIVSRVVSWVKSGGQFGVQFEEGSEVTLVFVRTWDRDMFRRVCVAVLSKYKGKASCDAAVLEQLLSFVVPSVLLVSFVGGITRTSRHLYPVSWEWVPGDAGRVPIFSTCNC